MASSQSVRQSSHLLSRALLLFRNNSYYNKPSLETTTQISLLFFFSRSRSYCSSTTHGVNASAGRISQGEPVKQLNESSSATHDGVNASTGVSHGEPAKRKPPTERPPGKKLNDEPEKSCSTTTTTHHGAGISQGKAPVKRSKPPPEKKLNEQPPPPDEKILLEWYLTPPPPPPFSSTVSSQTQKRDRIRPPKSHPCRSRGKRREVVESPPADTRGRIRPSKKQGKKKEIREKKKEVRNTFRRVGYVFNH